MIKQLFRNMASAGVTVMLVAGIALPAAAHELAEDVPGAREHAAEHTAESKTRLHGRLDEARKKVCEARAQNITKIMAGAAAAGQRHLETFSKILQRVQDFYVKKSVTVTNYDELVAAAAAKKTAAEQAIKNVKTSSTFNCSGDNPVASIDAFNSQVRAMRVALKDYRSAINNLLVAVKTATRGNN